MTTTDLKITRIDYEPSAPLDIDLRPLDGQELRDWRTQYTRMTQRDLADWTDLPNSVICSWETGGRAIPLHWGALLRERAVQVDFELPEGPVEPAHVRALSALLGGHRRLADALGLHGQTVRNWASDGNPQLPTIGGKRPLLRWLYEDFGLEPHDDLLGAGPDGVLTDAEVVEIRQRAASGVTGQELSEEYPVSHGTICRVIRGERYAHVDTAPVSAEGGQS